MRKLIENGHVYVAQPPLYKVKKGKREEYVDTEQKLDAMLIEIGVEGATLTRMGAKKGGSWTAKELQEILETTSHLTHLENHLERKGISFKRSEYTSSRHSKGR
jgi:DNA gyrase subunit B